MPEQVDVFYEGWGEKWLWGKLVSSSALTGRPLIAFEYSEDAIRKGLELSRLRLPLNGPRLRRDFPAHQLGLPGPVYDSLPDGWGMLLMDRLFKRRGLNAARIGPLERLTWVGNNAMGAMTFRPVQSDAETLSKEDVPLEQLASEVQEVLSGEGGNSCKNCSRWAVHRKGPGQKRYFIVTVSRQSSPLRLSRGAKAG